MRKRDRQFQSVCPLCCLEVSCMPTINLRKYYPFLTEDRFVEVSDEVVEAFLCLCDKILFKDMYYCLFIFANS